MQNRIGAKKAWGFDLSAACSGFAYALTVGAQFVGAGTHKKVLVIGSFIFFAGKNFIIPATAGIVPATAGRAAFDRSASVFLLDRTGRQRVLFQLEELTPETLAHDIRKLDGDPTHP